MKTKKLLWLVFVAALSWAAMPARAQWVTESFALKTGWNAIFLQIDCSHTILANLAPDGGPVQEVWMWVNPASQAQFVDSPQAPVTGSQWLTWLRADASSTLGTMFANAAYLVRVSSDYTWNLKGKPVAPRFSWSTSGLNFLGFPTRPDAPPSFNAFFAFDLATRQQLQAFGYYGGPLGDSNPLEIPKFLFGGTSVQRGSAFWMRASGAFLKNYGPFEVNLSGGDGIAFNELSGQKSFRLRNFHPTQTLTVTMKLLASETPPTGQPAIVGVPPLLVRGAQDLTTHVYAFSSLAPNGTVSFVLKPAGQPDSEIEVALGVNRYAMTGNAGDLFAGILRLTDSLNISQIDLPLSASLGSTAGLWVGKAQVTGVNSYLKTFQTDDNGVPMQNPDGRYVTLTTNTSSGPVAKAFPLRLIVHNDGSNAKLLERVFVGVGPATNPIVTLRESNLDHTQLSVARRISAPHLPWSAGNAPWALSGQFGQGQTLQTTVALDANDHASNPFLHTYHPDHDNLDALFQTVQPQGYESYGISRKITLQITPPANDFDSLTLSGQTLSGLYSEEIKLAGKGTESRTFNVSGIFSMNRLSTISVLTP